LPAIHAGAQGPAAGPKAKPLAGVHDGVFFLRDATDTFRLYPQGRVHVDGVASFGPGVSELGPAAALRPTIFLRRARAEASGELGKFQFTFQLEIGASALSNVSGRAAALDCAPGPSGAQTCEPSAASVDAPSAQTNVINAYVNYAADPLLNVQVGQFRVPFSLENRTGVNVIPFHERSLPVRVFRPPNGRDIGAMIWGETPGEMVNWALGIFTGDATDRPNVDRRFDVIGRTFVRPLRGVSALRGLQLGFSGLAGSRDPRLVGYDLPAMTTQAGFPFFSSTYRDSRTRLVHIVPSDLQRAFGAELFVPYGRFDVTAEAIALSYDTREDLDGLAFVGGSERKGRMQGAGWYAQLGAWVLGSRDIVGRPGTMRPLHLDFSRPSRGPAKPGLQLLARFEQLRLRYEASLRGGTDDPRTPSGRIAVDGVGFAANLWFSRHVRVSLDYLFYLFPQSAPVQPTVPGDPAQTSVQRAIAPAQRLDPGVDDGARGSGHSLHELSFRVGAQF
jgi:hypothetical protein